MPNLNSDIKFFFGQRVDIFDGLWVTKIAKPIYGNCVALNEKLLNSAIARGVKLKIVTPKASEVVDPAEWKAKAVRFSKVFRYPDRPMVMYQAVIGEHAHPEKQVERIQNSFDFDA